VDDEALQRGLQHFQVETGNGTYRMREGWAVLMQAVTPGVSSISRGAPRNLAKVRM
jgi:hypothetical protein